MPYPFQKNAVTQIMTTTEAANYLKMHIKTIRRLANEGKISGSKVGSEWQFLRSTLDKWLAETLI